MDRREFLLMTAAVSGLAGCGSRSDDTTVTTGSGTARPTETSTPTTDAPTTAPPTETPTETATESPTTTETATESSTESPTTTEDRPRAGTAAKIEAARSELETAFNEYTAFAGADAGFLDVTAAVTDFEFPAVTNPVREAGGRLDEAAATAREDQQAIINDLRDVASALDSFARAQADLSNAYEIVTTVQRNWYREEFQAVRDRRDRILRETETAAGRLDTLEADTDPPAMDAFEPLGRDRYERKLAQLRTEIDTAEELHAQFTPLEDGLERFEIAVDDYVAENWGRAGNKFGDAWTILDDPARELDDFDTAPSFASIVDELTSVTRSLAEASDALEAAADAAEFGNRSRQRRFKEDADEILRESEVAVDRIRSVQQILRAN